MEIPTISGYYNITYPLYENGIGSSIYCVTDGTNSILTIIALTPNFFNDIAKVIKRVSYSYIYLITPSINMYYISDIYSTWELCKQVRKNFKILSNNKFSFENNEDFRSSIIEGEHFVISRIDNHEDFYEMNTVIDLIPFESSSLKTGNDIILYDGSRKIYFMLYPDIYRIYDIFDNQEKYNGVDEIHVPLYPNIYGGHPYDEIIQNIPKEKKNIIYVNSLKSKMEYYYCEDNKIQLKENFSHAFI